MRIALAQINPTIGDLTGNVERMTRFAREAAARGAEVVVFPELSIPGYPPRDLVDKSSFVEANERCLQELAAATAGLNLSVICGYVGRSQAETGKRAMNSAAVLDSGEVLFRQSKMLLPNYDVFDEARYFRPAEREYLCTLRGTPVALTICEDAWNDRRFWKERLYQRGALEGRLDPRPFLKIWEPRYRKFLEVVSELYAQREGEDARAAAETLREHFAAAPSIARHGPVSSHVMIERNAANPRRKSRTR